MSLLKKTAVKAAIVTTLLVGGLAPVTVSAMTPVQTYNVAVRVDLGSKVRNVQRKMRPAGQKIKSTLTAPGRKAVIWVERNMSFPALILILVFGGVFVLMGSSSPTSRVGGYH